MADSLEYTGGDTNPTGGDNCCKFDNCLEILNQKYVEAKCKGCNESDYIKEKTRLERYIELEKLINLAVDCNDNLYANQLYVQQRHLCDDITEPHGDPVIYGCTDSNATFYNSAATDPCVLNGVVNGCCEESGGYTTGCTDPNALNYDPNADIDDGSCLACVYGCTNSTFANYNSLATCDDGSCISAVYGCMDSTAVNYNLNADVDDGSCVYPTITGCTDSTAWNYNSLATVDDGSCVIFGCTDPAATNYNSFATVDNGSCIWPVYGCTDSLALNYDPAATIDDGSCTVSVHGCTDSTAYNYNANANIDDGTCTYKGCKDPDATNFMTSCTSPGSTFTINDPECCDYHEVAPRFGIDVVDVDVDVYQANGNAIKNAATLCINEAREKYGKKYWSPNTLTECIAKELEVTVPQVESMLKSVKSSWVREE